MSTLSVESGVDKDGVTRPIYPYTDRELVQAHYQRLNLRKQASFARNGEYAIARIAGFMGSRVFTHHPQEIVKRVLETGIPGVKDSTLRFYCNIFRCAAFTLRPEFRPANWRFKADSAIYKPKRKRPSASKAKNKTRRRTVEEAPPKPLFTGLPEKRTVPPATMIVQLKDGRVEITMTGNMADLTKLMAGLK